MMLVIGSKYPAVKSALTKSTTGPSQEKTETPDCKAPVARYHLLINPLAGGIPIVSLGLIGIPPASGFISKWYQIGRAHV